MLHLQKTLQSRAQDVLNSTMDTAISNLKIFFEFINGNLLLKSIFDKLLDDLPNAEQLVSKIKQSRRLQFPSSYEDKIKFCVSILLNMIENDEEPYALLSRLSTPMNRNVVTKETMKEFFLPVWKYLDERLVYLDSFQYLLTRFKLNSEWFKKDYLFDLYSNNPTRGESLLDTELRAYLFGQGIDFPFSKPSSPSGEVDVLPLIEKKPIPLEIKVFDGDNRSRSYIRQGFKQAFSYAKDYCEASTYLVIFNVSRYDIMFNLSSSDVPQRLVIGDKTIYIFVINLYHHEKTASKRDLEPYVIAEEYLLENVN